MLTKRFHKYWIIMAAFAMMTLFVNIGSVSAHENHRYSTTAPTLTLEPAYSLAVVQAVTGTTFVQQAPLAEAQADNTVEHTDCPSSGSCCHVNCSMLTLPGSFRLSIYYAFFLETYQAVAVFPSGSSQGGLIRPPRQG